jgi:hypothetical protein
VQQTPTESRVRDLLSRFEGSSGGVFTAVELANATGLSPQQVAVVLPALELLGRVSQRRDPERRRVVWMLPSEVRPAPQAVRSPLRTWYTVNEAAALVGLSESALYGRIERKTVQVVREGRRIFVSHGALQAAGLLNKSRPTATTSRIEALVEALRRKPRRRFSTWQLVNLSNLPRQSAETALATFAAAGVVDRAPSAGMADWLWVGS